KQAKNGLDLISLYLNEVWIEADLRGYRFDKSKFIQVKSDDKIALPKGQLLYEWEHLLKKLAVRSPSKLAEIAKAGRPTPNPIFTVISGDICDWEKRH
ncbi:MAG: hypothetical protein HQK54_06260, partial [Oligoflexales bacterium]|nr:hypothetical protein [Oligoflexales bacterium]